MTVTSSIQNIERVERQEFGDFDVVRIFDADRSCITLFLPPSTSRGVVEALEAAITTAPVFSPVILPTEFVGECF